MIHSIPVVDPWQLHLTTAERPQRIPPITHVQLAGHVCQTSIGSVAAADVLVLAPCMASRGASTDAAKYPPGCVLAGPVSSVKLANCRQSSNAPPGTAVVAVMAFGSCFAHAPTSPWRSMLCTFMQLCAPRVENRSRSCRAARGSRKPFDVIAETSPFADHFARTSRSCIRAVLVG
jgi:hypothetical protein